MIPFHPIGIVLYGIVIGLANFRLILRERRTEDQACQIDRRSRGPIDEGSGLAVEASAQFIRQSRRRIPAPGHRHKGVYVVVVNGGDQRVEGAGTSIIRAVSRFTVPEVTYRKYLFGRE